MELVAQLLGQDTRRLGIGNAETLGFAHHLAEGSKGECLRSLCTKHPFASRHGSHYPIAVRSGKECLVGLYRSYCVAECAGYVEVALYDLGRDERTHCVMNHHKGFVRVMRQSCYAST